MSEEKKKTILLVEDEELVALSEKMILEKNGFIVIIAETGEKAIQIVQEKHDIDLILMDIKLGGGIDGAQAAASILKNNLIPVIFLSSYTEQEIVESTDGIDSYGYVAKDCGEAVLITTIKTALRLFENQMKEQALAQEQFFMKTLMENTSESIYFKDLRSCFIRISKAQAIKFRCSDPSEAVGKTDFDFFTEENARGKYEDEQEVIRTGQPINKEEMEILFGHTGTWVTTTKMPLYDGKGNIIGTFGISKDITERKIADEKIKNLLAEKELILKEVHHRIKNNMSTMISLLSLQQERLSNAEAKEAVKDAVERLLTMQVLYDKLYRSNNFMEISIKEYLTQLLEDLTVIFPNRESFKIETIFDDFKLGTSVLSVLGMLVNEIITNSMKYAFVGRNSGMIRVSASKKGNHVILVLEDNGIGIPESVNFNNSTGFGLMLVGELTKQLNGTIRLERENGTRIILEFDS